MDFPLVFLFHGVSHLKLGDFSMSSMKIITLFAIIGISSSVAFGGLVVDMRNVTQTGSAYIDPINHMILPTLSDVGDIITFQVWATVWGGTTTNDLISVGMFMKESNTVQGCVKGNMAGLNGNAPDLSMFTSNFQGGSRPSESTNNISGDTEFNDSSNPFFARNASGIDASGSGIELGEFTYTITSLVGSSTTPTVISLVPRTTSTAGALYFEDGINYKGNSRDSQNNYLYTAGPGANWSIGMIPEPSTFILLGMGVISLLAYGWRRRK
jgi:PEP-CTERM motif